MINRAVIWTLIAFISFAGIALGGYDLSGSEKAESLSTSSSALQGIEAGAGALAGAEIPQMTATAAGTEQAAHIPACLPDPAHQSIKRVARRFEFARPGWSHLRQSVRRR